MNRELFSVVWSNNWWMTAFGFNLLKRFDSGALLHIIPTTL